MIPNSTLTLSLLFLVTLFVSSIPPSSQDETGLGGGGGMVPVEVKEEIDPKNTPEKIKAKQQAHLKIAESHLSEQDESEGFIVDDDGEKRVVRKDKLLELQNPEKHSSDEWPLLKFLLKQYLVSEKENKIEEQVEILQNLEHFSHKFENGRDLFTNTEALQTVLLPALNSTHSEIRRGACSVFAISTQNNPIVQKIALDSGALRPLIQLITVEEHLVRAKALYAISSLTRNYPDAQRKFINEGGIGALISAFRPETRKRAITLITDLLTERAYCRSDHPTHTDPNRGHASSGDWIDLLELSDDPCDSAKVLERSLELNGWCDLLSDSVEGIGGLDDEDQITIIEAAELSLDLCLKELGNFSNLFRKLGIKFGADEDYRESVWPILERISKRIRTLKMHEEL